MMKAVMFVPVFLLAFFGTYNCQTNGVRPILMPCYNVSALPGITTAENRHPTSLNIFLEMIRRLEDANPTKTTQELAVLILQRLRQDGIIATGKSVDNRFSLPFSPYGLEGIKQSMITESFLPNPSVDLYYGDLDPVEICSLHYMISSAINITRRGDETSTCTRSARYTSRLRRDLESDVQPPVGSETENPDIEAVEFQPRSFVNVPEVNGRSQCPVELGVLYTNYGTIKAGQVLNGIATGLAAQTINNSDNRYASTICGELVEAALVQSTEAIEVGVDGGWNGTINPKYYFLQKNDKLDITDAEIRGSLDGLFMALRIENWRSTFADLKISQILDLYYSSPQKGVFDSTFKACNRNILFTEMTSRERLQTETFNLMAPMNQRSGLPNSVSSEAYPTLSNASLEAFYGYLPRLIRSDLQCPPVDSYIERAATDLLIFIDSTWSFNTVQLVISNILDSIDVNKFGSRYTVFSGFNTVNITSNSTRYLLDFQKQYNITVHQNTTGSFDYAKIYETMEAIVRSKLNNNTYMGGESTIVLLMPRTPPNENQRSFLEQRKEIMKQFMPDLTVLVLGSGSQGDFSSVLVNPNRDFVSMSESTNENDIKIMVQSVVDKIKNVPRSLVNPSCGSQFNGATSSFRITDYVEPNGVNYYKVSPNYFTTGGESRNLRIESTANYGTINVCISRDQSRPNNQSSDCETSRNTVMTRDITTYCDGSSVSSCSPIYISISGNTTRNQCRDYRCRFPENIQYTIGLENVGCASGSFRNVASFFVVLVLFIFQGF
ncbi:hypothetical protein JTB14_004376 [Gonioctena quinquepunctata]|nr:hypothetical protein JTB14_004376 [Gonioctena quinquepunctata]